MNHLDEIADATFQFGRAFLVAIFVAGVSLIGWHVAPKAFATAAIDTNPHCTRNVCHMPLEE